MLKERKFVWKSSLILSLLFLALWATNTHADSDFIRGEGNFISRDDDSLSFIRSQLLASATRDVITKELEQMGLDANLFWQQFDQRFEDSFQAQLEQLKQEYDIEEGEEVAQSDRQAFNEELRKRRLSARANYGALNRVIPSYSIQRTSRSTQMPNSRFLALQARVDRELLTSIYYDFTQEGEIRHFPKLYLTTDFRLSQMSWADTGVDFGHDFIDVVNEHWQRWLQENLASYIDEIVLTDTSLEEELTSFVRLGPKIGRSGGFSDDLSNNDLEGGFSSGGILQNEMGQSLWLKIIVQLTKVDDRIETSMREFEIDGEFVLIDLHTNQLIKSFDFVRELRSFSTEDNHRLSSELASLVYRVPVVELEQLTRTFHDFSGNRRAVSIEVRELSNIQELLRFARMLSEKGISARVESTVDSYNGSEGTLQLTYQGEVDDLVQVLKSIDRANIDERRITIPDPERPYSFVFEG